MAWAALCCAFLTTSISLAAVTLAGLEFWVGLAVSAMVGGITMVISLLSFFAIWGD